MPDAGATRKRQIDLSVESGNRLKETAFGEVPFKGSFEVMPCDQLGQTKQPASLHQKFR